MDLVLRGGLVVDGSGQRERFRADVGVHDGVVERVGTIPRGEGAEEVDLDGLVLAPGFIDTHTHFDAQVFWDPDFTPSSWHGVTTVIQANCGFGIAPTRPEDRYNMMDTLHHVEGMNIDALTAGIDWSFETFTEYMSRLRALPKRINLASYVGHTPLRVYVMGLEEAATRAATDEEIAQMRSIVRGALAEGAVGLSTSFAPSHHGARGLPVPSRLASPEEMRGLVEEVAAAGNKLAMFTYGPQFSIEEVAEISRDLGVRCSWGSLLTGLFGERGAAMAMLDRASEIGGDIWPQISCRFITLQFAFSAPNYFGNIPAFTDVLAAESQADRMRILGDPAWRDVCRPQVGVHRPRVWLDSTLQESDAFPHYVGRPVLDIAAELGVDPLDAVLDIALADKLNSRFRIVINNNDKVEMTQLLRDPRTMLGAHDAGAHVDMLCDSNFPTHLLAYWVRETGVLSVEEAVWRLSGQPADVFRLAGRGLLREGCAADLVAFDPDTVAAIPEERVWDFPAGADRLISRSAGIEHTWVNGVAVRSKGDNVPDAHPGVVVT